ncbi:MAG TPA: zinc-dependent alcohol dehydrogenase family protein [Steroidobacteraceae bacterium]|nr:zinc-dependent alcohol dehydrogenase family protein [Steroidobacteraceae bacterium]
MTLDPFTSFAMRIGEPGGKLQPRQVELAPPGAHGLLIRVAACGVCRTDLHLLDGELGMARYPVTPGHEIVGRVLAIGSAVSQFRVGDRVGVPWLGGSCGSCAYCLQGRENLCDRPVFTGATIDGGYAELAAADARYCLAIPEGYSDVQAAPLLCAGLIGYRAYKAAGDARRIGLYGFGAAAHLLAQVAAFQGRQVFAFTRPGDIQAQAFARELGAVWAGGSDESPPEALDAAILFAPVGELVPAALRAVRKGARVVCAGIHMSDIPAFPYELLWEERSICSVANLTRQDGHEFMRLAAAVALRPVVEPFPLREAATAIERLRNGTVHGAAVLVCEEGVPR